MISSLLLGAFLTLSAQEKSSENAPVSLETLRLVRSVCSEVPDAYNACKYFSEHPDKPEIKIVFKETGEPGQGPLLLRKDRRLNRVEITVNRNIQDIFSGHPKMPQEEKVKRLAALAAPQVFGDLQVARLMEEHQIPNYFQADLIEKLRLLYETGALQRLASDKNSVWSEKTLLMMPGEVNHLENRLNVENALLTPKSAYVSEVSAQRWDALCKGEKTKCRPLAVLEGARKNPDAVVRLNQEVFDKNLKEVRALAVKSAGIPSDLYENQAALERAQIYLNEDRASILAAALEAEIKDSIPFAEKFPVVDTRMRISLHMYASKADEAIKDLDYTKLNQELGKIEGAAKQLGMDGNALRAEFEKRFMNSAPHAVFLKQIQMKEHMLESLYQLGRAGPQAKGVVQTLSKVALEEDGAESSVALQILGRMGAPALPVILKCIKSKDRVIHSQAYELLKNIVPANEAEIGVLADIADNKDVPSLGRQQIYANLIEFGPKAVPRLIQSIKHPDSESHYWVVKAMNETLLFPANQKFLAQADDSLIQALAERALHQDARDPNQWIVSSTAAGVLYQIGKFNKKKIDKVLPHLRKVYAEGGGATRSQVGQAIRILESSK